MNGEQGHSSPPSAPAWAYGVYARLIKILGPATITSDDDRSRYRPR